MSSETFRILLPRQMTLGNNAEILNFLESVPHDQAAELDFSSVDDLDSTGVAVISHLRNSNPRIVLIHVQPRFQRILDVFSVSASTSGKDDPVAVADLATLSGGSRENMKQFFVLIADEIMHTWNFLKNRRGVYPKEIRNQLYQMGYGSFFIVSLITFLVGVTIALTSAQQLNAFGADIFLADLVGYGMIRELVPLMAGIILAGKVGASITAEIASMKVLEEVDALQTMGLEPKKFLMVPRLIAISVAVPLLVVVANFVGIFGGMLVGKMYSAIPFSAFYHEMLTIVTLGDVLIGLGKTLVFGWAIVLSSGFKGFSVTRGALGVGIATTESVVLSISLIISLDCVFALLLY